MKFISYLTNEAPNEIKVSVVSGLSGGLIGIYQFMTDDIILKLLTALGVWGAIITMILSWIYWLIKIRKERNLK